MTFEDLDRVERTLGITLPGVYRATMLSYPFPADSAAAESWLVDDVEQLLTVNRMWRAGELHGRPWPSHLFGIGDDGGEDAYFLDLSVDPARVLAFAIDTGQSRLLAPDLETFLAQLRRDLEGIEEGRREMNKAYHNKKWWQFWIRPWPRRRAT